MEYIFFILSLIFVIYNYYTFKKVLKEKNNIKEINTKVQEENNLLEEQNKKLLQEKEKFITEIEVHQTSLTNLKLAIENSQHAADNAQEAMKKGLEQYGINLESAYCQKEKEYDALLQELYNSYDIEQENLMDQVQEEKDKLEFLRSTRAAAIQAQIKEKEIKDKKSFYCLQPAANELDDIKALERVKPILHQPRILCLFIWSTYFQKPMTALCNNILGTAIVCGIYKITTQETGECYVGQAVDVAKRWKDHAKCGLGIDTPVNNKLYKAMKEYGIWNFSWELLEKCSKEELTVKEDFYIDLYDSKNYGYNSSIGEKKVLFE